VVPKVEAVAMHAFFCFINYIKNFYRNMSIRKKIFFFNVIIVIVPLSTFALFANLISTRAIIDKATKNSCRELALIDKSLNVFTDNIEDYARILATDHRLQERMKAEAYAARNFSMEVDTINILSEVLSNIVKPNTSISAASVMAVDGDFIKVGEVDNTIQYPIYTPEFIDFVKKKQAPVWTNLFKLRYGASGEEKNVFGIAKSIIHKDTGKTIGIVFLYVEEKTIASIYLDRRPDVNINYFILNKENGIISSQNKNDLYKEFNHKIIGGNISIPASGSMIMEYQNQQVLITTSIFEKLDWKLVSIVPLDEITAENKNINQLILTTGILCLVFAFFTTYLLSRSISNPILKLVTIMKNIKAGNLDVRADFSTNDEIGLLGDGFNSLMHRMNGLMDEIYTEQIFRRESEFKLLQSQINPHFLYNTIETIISFIKLDMKDNAIITAKYLASFYRISLSKGNDIISIGEEVLLTNSYLSIQKLRYFEYMDFKVEFDEDIMAYSIPKLTLQPVVENAIYHGLKEKNEKGFLHIKGYKQNDTIIIEVFDNGVGMTKEKTQSILSRAAENDAKKEFGIGSVDLRVKLLYGSNYGLRIESEVGGFTRVILSLPAILK